MPTLVHCTIYQCIIILYVTWIFVAKFDKVSLFLYALLECRYTELFRYSLSLYNVLSLDDLGGGGVRQKCRNKRQSNGVNASLFGSWVNKLLTPDDKDEDSRYTKCGESSDSLGTTMEYNKPATKCYIDNRINHLCTNTYFNWNTWARGGYNLITWYWDYSEWKFTGKSAYNKCALQRVAYVANTLKTFNTRSCISISIEEEKIFYKRFCCTFGVLFWDLKKWRQEN